MNLNQKERPSVTYNDFMDSYKSIVNFNFRITDIVLIMCCSYLIQSKNEIESLYKRYFIEFSIKLFSILIAIVSFLGFSFFSSFDFTMIGYSFLASCLLILVTQFYFYSTYNVFNRTLMNNHWDLVRNNIALSL